MVSLMYVGHNIPRSVVVLDWHGQVRPGKPDERMIGFPPGLTIASRHVQAPPELGATRWGL